MTILVLQHMMVKFLPFLVYKSYTSHSPRYLHPYASTLPSESLPLQGTNFCYSQKGLTQIESLSNLLYTVLKIPFLFCAGRSACGPKTCVFFPPVSVSPVKDTNSANNLLLPNIN